MIKKLLLPITICFIYSCAPSRFVKPLDAKQQAVNLSLGGPIIDYSDLAIPMPFITATYGYGINSSLTAFGSVNITSAFYGNAQLELGATKRLLKQKNSFPGISINPVANIVYRDKDAFRLFPQLDINAFWDHNKGRNFFYAGISINNAALINKVQQPLFWIHGVNDDFLPINTQGELVYKNHVGIYKEAHRIAGAGHSDVPKVMGFQNYLKAVGDFITR